MDFRTTKNRSVTLTAFLIPVVYGLLLTQCKKYEVSAEVIVKTEGVSEVTLNTCKASGTLVDVGSTGVKEYGFCWSTTTNPAQASDCEKLGPRNEKGSYSTTITGLTNGTTYHIWAFGENEDGRKYGKAVTFTTLSVQLPTVETGAISNITSTTAQCGYNVVSDGGSPVTERGLCWGTQASPSIDGDHASEGAGTGTYTGSMVGLTPDTDYYVRAYAVNEVGVAYGNDQTFATLPDIGVPVVHTGPAEAVMASSATITANISSDGGSVITDKGFCWNTEPNPTTANNNQVVGSGPDPWEITIPGLSPNTTYYVRAFASNIAGTGYGEQQMFRTLNEPLVDDRDGKTYQTVKIGEQVWMAENLDYGDFTMSSQVPANDGTVQKYCFDDNPDNCNLYGGLYNGNEMLDYTNVEMAQGICPDGWHMPSDAEWKIMEMALGMTQEAADQAGPDQRGTTEGGKLKEAGLTFWQDPNTAATNETGFSGRGAGWHGSGRFNQLTEVGMFWTSTTHTVSSFWVRQLSYNWSDIKRIGINNTDAVSVRCIKD